MEKSITCFIESGNNSDLTTTIESFIQSSCVKELYIVSEQEPDQELLTKSTKWLNAPSLQATKAIKKIAELSHT